MCGPGGEEVERLVHTLVKYGDDRHWGLARRRRSVSSGIPFFGKRRSNLKRERWARFLVDG